MLSARRLRTVLVLMGILLSIALVFIAGLYWFSFRLEYAGDLVEDREYEKARGVLKSYLTLYPRNDHALMLMAEAFIKDNSLPVVDVGQNALKYLNQIPQDSFLSADARLAEGRIYFLLLLQAGRAERCFLQVLKLNPDKVEAHALLWKLYCLTGRWFQIENHFREVLRHTKPDDRAWVLREWYMSEFGQSSAAASLERQMGILKDQEAPSVDSKARRDRAFIAAEPDCPIGYACFARWYQRQAMHAKAKEMIRQAEEVADGANNPFVIATHVTICIERGEFPEALEVFKRWPATDTGYEYWKTRGLVYDQILREDQTAREAYEKSLEFPAGESDWQTRHRLGNVLMRLGETDKMTSVRQQSKKLEGAMEIDVHRTLRKALVNPLDPRTIELMADFYNQNGRSLEYDAWKELLSITPAEGESDPWGFRFVP